MGKFRWLKAGSIPAAYDLRRCGWALVAAPCLGPGDSVGLLSVSGDERPAPLEPRLRAATLLFGIDEAARRAALLRAGFAEVLGSEPVLDELEARAARVLARLGHAPPVRRHEGLVLDLLARDAFAAGRAVGLHPREFALLWRLMDAGGAPLDKACLLAEVWHLQHVPETNSLPVHVSRLRRKLAAAGYPSLIATKANGYAYVPPLATGPALPFKAGDGALDVHVRIADQPFPIVGEDEDEARIRQ